MLKQQVLTMSSSLWVRNLRVAELDLFLSEVS